MIDNILKDLNKRDKEYNRQYLKELKQAKTGEIKAVVFYNKYKTLIWCLPCHLKRFYEFDLERGDLKVKELTTEQFKEVLKLQDKIGRLKNKKDKYLKEVLK